MYQRECGVHCLELLSSDSSVPALDFVLQNYTSEHYIGPLVRFSHGQPRGPSSLEWKGSILLAVEQGYQHLSMTFQSTVRATSSASHDQVYRPWPERPVKVPGCRFLDCYGYHFWRFDLSISLHPSQETDCKYSFSIIRHSINSHISGRFWLGSIKACTWRVRFMASGVTTVDTQQKVSNLQDSREYHIAVLPDWSPFFLENKIRAEVYRRTFASTPYICEPHHTSNSPSATMSDGILLSNGNSTSLWQTVFSLHQRPQDNLEHRSHSKIIGQSLGWSAAIWSCLQAFRSSRWPTILLGRA